ncbi:MAG: protein adenylyltransferase SelO [Flavobacteriales bacterium]
MDSLFDKKLNPQFSGELPADSIEENGARQVQEACFSFVETKKPGNPELVHHSTSLMKELEIEMKDEVQFLNLVSGAAPFKDFKSYAMCYGGHQFGSWAGQLGDGRAINIAELELNEENWKFQLKGSGPTPYSRGADGFAVLRSSVREYLCSEAMHNLGIATTRALSLVKTGDLVTRDMLYDGNPAPEQGAVVCRISPSFIRFGSFEILAARRENHNLKKLADYTIKHHYSSLGEPSKEVYVQLFKEVADATRKMIVDWQRVGFVHGVMNTDNMSILGLTIDYGPYGWLEDYDPGWTPNTTDLRNKRYRFGNQASVSLWNLTQLANSLYPLIEEAEPLQAILDEYRALFLADYHEMMCQKLGLSQADKVKDDFISDLEKNLTKTEIDYTLFFRELSNKQELDFDKFWNIVLNSSYLKKEIADEQQEVWRTWFGQFVTYILQENENRDEREAKMKATNPKYVLRNYMAQLAIDEAEKGDYGLIDELYQLLEKPYEEQPKMEKWFAKRPEWARNKVGCSMLSCSS